MTGEDATALRMDGRRLEAISHGGSLQGPFGGITDDSVEHLDTGQQQRRTYLLSRRLEAYTFFSYTYIPSAVIYIFF